MIPKIAPLFHPATFFLRSGPCGARTSTIALTNATIGYALEIADKGWRRAAADNPIIASGLNLCHGQVTNRAGARTFGLEFSDPAQMLNVPT